MDLLKTPIRLVSYLTRISPFSPGSIGSSGFLGMVQPHDDWTFFIISGAFPLFIKVKTQEISSRVFLINKC